MDITSDPMPMIAFARRLGVVPHTAREWARVGLCGGAVKLRTIRRGRRVFVAWADYLEWQAKVDAWKPPVVPLTPRGRARDIARCMAELLR